MINPEDEVLYDERLGCTEEEAVAKLLGWMRGIKRLRCLSVTEMGLNPEQFPHMFRLPTPLYDLIRDEREMASAHFKHLCIARNFDLASEWESRVKYWDAIAERAMRYKQAISEELSRQKPRLITEKSLTNETGKHHITLVSLDYWSKITFGDGVLDSQEQAQMESLPPLLKRPRTKGLEKESKIIETIIELGYDPLKLPPRTPGIAGTKSAVWNRLNGSFALFTSKKSFDTTWEDLRREKRLAEIRCPLK